MILLNRIKYYVFLILMIFSSIKIHAQISREEFNDELLKVKDETSATKLIEKHSLTGFITEISEARDTNELSDELFKLKLREPYYYYLGNDEYCAYPLKTGKKMFYRVNYIYFPSNIYSRKMIDSLRPLIMNRIKNGESFSDLAWQYSYGGGFDRGDLYWFYDGMMVKGFQDAIENHKKGDLYVLDLPEEKWSYIVQNAYSPKKFETLTYLKIEKPPGNTDMQLYKLIPRWNIGDIRIVSSNSTSTIVKNDSLINKVELKSTYKIELLDTNIYYTFHYSGGSNIIDFNSSFLNNVSDSMSQFLSDVFKTIERKYSDFTYKIQVDKTTLKVVKILNVDEFKTKLEEIILMVFSEFGRSKGIGNNEIEQMKLSVPKTFDTLIPNILKTITDSYDTFFEDYRLEFPLNSSYSSTTDFESKDILGGNNRDLIPVKLTISSEVNDSTIKVYSETFIEKEIVLEILKKNRPALKNITEDEIFVSYKENFNCDLNSGWLISKESEHVTIIRDLKVNSSMKIEFR